MSRLPRSLRNLARVIIIVIIVVLLVVMKSLSSSGITCLWAAGVTNSTLPGEQRWLNGYSSFLFGANDASWDWSAKNLGNSSLIRSTVKATGITVIRSPLTAKDALKRVSAIEMSGADCFGILMPQDALQVVRELGKRCNIYEWQNEPDNNGISAASYAASWNQYIPKLRSINPNAVFIGPVVSYANTAYIQKFLSATKGTGNLPDAISYHMYPCTGLNTASCSLHIVDYTRTANSVRSAVIQIIGHALPIAVTEWNYSWKPRETPNQGPYMQQFTVASLQAMAAGGVEMANEFDLASQAGYGSLDMVNPSTGHAYGQMIAIHSSIMQYHILSPTPTPPIQTTSPEHRPGCF